MLCDACTVGIRRGWPLGPWLAVALVGALTTPADAQDSKYKSLEVDKSLGSRGAIVRRYLQSGTGDEQEFRDYFAKYYFPSMTQATPEGLSDLGKLGSDLFKNYIFKASGANQKYLSDEALQFAVGVIRERRFHPAVRLNAFLVLGRLNDSYGDPPVPSARANDALCSLAKRALTSGRVPRYELTGALTGLQRHARFLSGMPAKQKSETFKTLYAILKTDEIPGEYDEGVRDWIYLQAADAVASVGTAGPKGVFALTIAKRCSDESLSLETRVELASLLKDLNLKAGEFDGAPVVKDVAALASKVAERESEFATAFEDLGIGGRPGRAAMDRDLQAIRVKEGENREVQLVRDGIVELLVDLRDGVAATKPIAVDASQAAMAEVEQAIGDALKVATEKRSTDLAITDAINKMARRVTDATAPILAPPEEAVAAE